MAFKFANTLAKSLLMNSKSSQFVRSPFVIFGQRNLSQNSPSDYTFRQLIDYDTSTYTYILGDNQSGQAIIIDPVLEQVERDAKLLKQLNLDLKYALNTHMHADHITGSGELRKIFKNCQSIISKKSPAVAWRHVDEGDVLEFGKFKLECLSTPGHTNGCITYLWREKNMAFTGDAVFIRGCGRTDFQEGSAETLYKSVHGKIFSLPDHFLLYPCHDYNGHTVTTVGEEKRFNPRLSKSFYEFVDIMNNLKLEKPKFLDVAIPGNLVDGLLEEKQKANE